MRGVGGGNQCCIHVITTTYKHIACLNFSLLQLCARVKFDAISCTVYACIKDICSCIHIQCTCR